VLALLEALVGALVSAMRPRASLVAENLALRQQLAVLRVGRRPRLRSIDRAFWVVLSRVWSRWVDVLAVVAKNSFRRDSRPVGGEGVGDEGIGSGAPIRG
jgi:hypothetical protein